MSSCKISTFESSSAKTDCANKNELQNIMKDKMITLFHKTIIFPPFSHTLPFLSIIHKEGESSVKISNKSQCVRSEEHTSELQSRFDLVCRLLLEKKK